VDNLTYGVFRLPYPYSTILLSSIAGYMDACMTFRQILFYGSIWVCLDRGKPGGDFLAAWLRALFLNLTASLHCVAYATIIGFRGYACLHACPITLFYRRTLWSVRRAAVTGVMYRATCNCLFGTAVCH